MLSGSASGLIRCRWRRTRQQRTSTGSRVHRAGAAGAVPSRSTGATWARRHAGTGSTSLRCGRLAGPRRALVKRLTRTGRLGPQRNIRTCRSLPRHGRALLLLLTKLRHKVRTRRYRRSSHRLTRQRGSWTLRSMPRSLPVRSPHRATRRSSRRRSAGGCGMRYPRSRRSRARSPRSC